MREEILNETFDGTFPFKPHFKNINGFRMHYVDEGKGEPIVCLHGEPTWGYLYRNFIPPLSKTHRVIVPDHMGFGKSDVPQDKPYTLAQHIDNLTKLLLELDLKDITLVGQDWGGPIMFGFAVNHPQRVKRLVIMNTAVGVMPEGSRTWVSNMEEQGTYDGFFENLRETLPILLKRGGVGKDTKVTDTMIRAYTAPFPDKASTKGAKAFPRDIPVGMKHPSAKVMKDILDKLHILRDKPKIIIWGLQDPVFPRSTIDWWLKIYPGTKVYELPEASHFLQEDAPEKIVKIIQEFLGVKK
ncbi:MAG: alpha/beta fold hydrolase [Candidatus Freyarchaeota archaeon]|nr:alpha/beta fold hydrolase [Candidatus Jordarchaeia archaeon]MBS7279011.1 alpha/beta fold hydrolase [Candidatus Jordarchaeia archaeon]